MVDELIEDAKILNNLNVEDRANVALCPACTAELEPPPKGYINIRLMPDTRWFYCSSCDAVLGYHRMKKKWYVDPSDLELSEKFRELLNLPE